MALYNRLKKGKGIKFLLLNLETVDPPSKDTRRNAWTDLKSRDSNINFK